MTLHVTLFGICDIHMTVYVTLCVTPPVLRDGAMRLAAVAGG